MTDVTWAVAAKVTKTLRQWVDERDEMTKTKGYLRVPDVVPLVDGIYSRNPSGCCLHRMMTDGGLDDRVLALCLVTAKERVHPDCIDVLMHLASMSAKQRKQVYKLRTRVV